MHRTETKTEQAKQQGKEPRQKEINKSRDAAAEWVQTAEMILAGGNWEQFPPERILGLSGAIGNAALGELVSMRETGPGFAERQLPRGDCDTVPMEQGPFGGPLLVSSDEAFAASPAVDAQPLIL